MTDMLETTAASPDMTRSARANPRDIREAARQQRFKQDFVADTPAWYRGELHLAFNVLLPVGVIAWCASQMQSPSPAVWLLVLPVALLGNWIEWAAHRYILHRPLPGLKMIYKRHCSVHHQFFTHHDLGFSGHREWRALLFPPFAPAGFIVAAIPPALLLGWLVSPNAGYVVEITIAAYYLLYEGLHTLSHFDNEDYPWLAHMPLVNTVRRMHRIHHVLGFMQTRNFNLTFPICDALFATSDLDRGLVGTLFNGESDTYVRRDLRPDPEAPQNETV